MDITSLPKGRCTVEDEEDILKKMYYDIIRNIFRDINIVLVLLIAQKAFEKNQALPKPSHKLTSHVNQEIHIIHLQKLRSGWIRFSNN